MKSKYLSILDVNPAGERGRLHSAIQPYHHGGRWKFQARLPSDKYKNIVSYYHQVHVPENNQYRTIYPTGNTAIVFRFDDLNPNVFLVGTPTLPREAEYVTLGCDYFVVLFWPGMGHIFHPVPAIELTDKSLPLDELFPGDSERLLERMVYAKDFEERVQVIEQFFEGGMILSGGIPNQVLSIGAMICRNTGYWDGNTLEGYTQRHTRRLFQRYLGVSPRLFRRIMRHQKTLRVLNSKPHQDMAGLAWELGYYDQAHFIREFKRFQGSTPTQFIKEFSRFD